MRSYGWLTVLILVILFPVARVAGFNPFLDRLFNQAFHPDWIHVVSHTLLFAALAALLAAQIHPNPSRLPRILAISLLVGSLQEVIQLAAAGRHPGLGELYDLGVDLAGALLGYFLSTTIFPRMLPLIHLRQLEGDKE
jgi:VanZ family protein